MGNYKLSSLNLCLKPQRSEPGTGALVFICPDMEHMVQGVCAFFLLLSGSQRACLYTKGSSEMDPVVRSGPGVIRRDLPLKEPSYTSG